jgi:hypothetical protein
MLNVDSRPSRAVNIPEDILDRIGIVARSQRKTIRGMVIDILENHLENVYPNLEQVMKELSGEE